MSIYDRRPRQEVEQIKSELRMWIARGKAKESVTSVMSGTEQSVEDWWANAIQLACDNVMPKYSLTREETFELLDEVEGGRRSAKSRPWWRFWSR
jgi:hypothetical protein